MKPTKYTEEGKAIVFHYSYVDLKQFIKHGHEHGDNGWILTKKEGDLMTLRGFGTIENPLITLQTICYVRYTPFDGEFNLEAFMNPPPPEPLKGEMIILDLSKLDTNFKPR